VPEKRLTEQRGNVMGDWSSWSNWSDFKVALLFSEHSKIHVIDEVWYPSDNTTWCHKKIVANQNGYRKTGYYRFRDRERRKGFVKEHQIVLDTPKGDLTLPSDLCKLCGEHFLNHRYGDYAPEPILIYRMPGSAYSNFR